MYVQLDVLSLLPLDVFYLVPSVNYCSLLRLPRVLKVIADWSIHVWLSVSSLKK